MTHRHRPMTERMSGWSRCVDPYRCDGRAHGNVVWLQVCRCGASRQIEINGRWSVTSHWTDLDEAGAR